MLSRVLFARSTIVAWPKLASNGEIEKTSDGKTVVVRHRCYIGSELVVPGEVAAELIERGLARLFVENGLSPSPDTMLQALPPPMAPEKAFALQTVDEAGADAPGTFSPPPVAYSAPQGSPPPRSGQLRDLVR